MPPLPFYNAVVTSDAGWAPLGFVSPYQPFATLFGNRFSADRIFPPTYVCQKCHKFSFNHANVVKQNRLHSPLKNELAELSIYVSHQGQTTLRIAHAKCLSILDLCWKGYTNHQGFQPLRHFWSGQTHQCDPLPQRGMVEYPEILLYSRTLFLTTPESHLLYDNKYNLFILHNRRPLKVFLPRYLTLCTMLLLIAVMLYWVLWCKELAQWTEYTHGQNLCQFVLKR